MFRACSRVSRSLSQFASGIAFGVHSTPDMTDQPGLEYLRRRDERRAAAAREEDRSRRIWLWRRVVFAVGAGLVVLTFLGALAPWWLLPPVVVFIALMATHQQVIARRDDFARAADFYERGDRAPGGPLGRRRRDGRALRRQVAPLRRRPRPVRARVALRAALHGADAGRRGDAGRLAAARRRRPRTCARARQGVAELRPRLDLREDLALLGAEVTAGAHPEGRAAPGPGARPRAGLAVAPPSRRCVGAAARPLASSLWLGSGYRQPLLVALMAEASSCCATAAPRSGA